jgi:hypothetical protein
LVGDLVFFGHKLKKIALGLSLKMQDFWLKNDWIGFLYLNEWDLGGIFFF